MSPSVAQRGWGNAVQRVAKLGDTGGVSTEDQTPAKPVRVDQWLWAVRLFKTRSAAKNACSKGAVKIGGEVAKPASKVNVGATVTVRRRGFVSTYEVVRPIAKRVGAKVAVDCVIDHTPEHERRAAMARRAPTIDGEPFEPIAGVREPGTGRPSKRERRQMDKLRPNKKR